MVLKVVLSGLLFGGVNAMMYAFAGGLVSMVFMTLLSRVKGVHPVMVSMVGGVAHNVGQVALAMVILSTPSLMYYMAVLMVAGLITGAVTGVAANLVMKHLQRFADNSAAPPRQSFRLPGRRFVIRGQGQAHSAGQGRLRLCAGTAPTDVGDGRRYAGCPFLGISNAPTARWLSGRSSQVQVSIRRQALPWIRERRSPPRQWYPRRRCPWWPCLQAPRCWGSRRYR